MPWLDQYQRVLHPQGWPWRRGVAPQAADAPVLDLSLGLQSPNPHIVIRTELHRILRLQRLQEQQL